MKRIFLFFLTNVAVLAVFTIVARIVGLDTLLARRGVDMGGLLVTAAVIGFVGSFISLAISKWSAKAFMGVQVIETPSDPTQRWLFDAVRRQAERVSVGMPEIGVFEADEMNAFATGASRDHALVAVSTGLLARMSPDEAEAVLGHEMTHVANGDMVTMALLQGVINTFVIFLARVFGTLLDSILSGGRESERRGPGPFYFVLVVMLQIVLGVLANIVVMWFSRRREFRADAGGAALAGTGNMIAALERLNEQPKVALPGALAAFGISGGAGQGLQRLFMSHPPIAERIAALQAATRGQLGSISGLTH